MSDQARRSLSQLSQHNERQLEVSRSKIQEHNLQIHSRLHSIAQISRVSPKIEIGANGHKRLISFLDRAGPVSLNTVSRRCQYKEIARRNSVIQSHINIAKSDYSLKSLEKHRDTQSAHKQLLQNKGTSLKKIDPLIARDRSYKAIRNSLNQVSMSGTEY